MKERTVHAGRHTIVIRNDDKLLFPTDGITKGQLVDYYSRIARCGISQWKNYPVSMERYPDGIRGKRFFQKNIPNYFPDWIGRATLEKKRGSVTHVLVNERATAAYLAGQGCITLHLGLARVDRPQFPDRMIFDLDPSDDDFGKVRKAALLTKDLLDALRLPSCVQTTGSRGLHVIVPLIRSVDFGASKAFSRAAAKFLADRHPDLLTVEQRKEERGHRVFVDYLRNDYAQTAVGPYAVRARRHAPVATPLAWSEVQSARLRPDRYTIENIWRRLAHHDDPWTGMRRASLSTAANRLSNLSG